MRFVQDFFNYRSLHIEKQIPANTGYAGFRLLCELNEPGKWDELGSFLGASYFRLLGRNRRTASRRAGWRWIAARPIGPRSFRSSPTGGWASRHVPDDRLRLYAILDSVSCAGAYSFLIKPGETTVADHRCGSFFPRPGQGSAGGSERGSRSGPSAWRR